jgi:acetyl esterase/lipase
MADQKPGQAVPARTIPIPTTISPEAQAALARPNPYGGRDEEPDPSDKAAWETQLAERDAVLAEAVAQGVADASRAVEVREHKLSASTLYEIVPKALMPEASDKALFNVHGGGFTLGGGITAARMAVGMTALTGVRSYAPDYRMPPRWPFPAALDDAVEAYRFVLERHAPQKVAAYGASAGGGLVASCLLKARDLGLPMPAACVLHSPEADLTESGDSFETNDGVDPVLKRLTKSIALYADGHDLKDPYLSPLFGDFSKGFPPSILTAGTRDLFLSNTVLMHRTLRRAGVPAELHIWEAMGHAGFYGSAPEDREVFAEHARFILDHL